MSNVTYKAVLQGSKWRVMKQDGGLRFWLTWGVGHYVEGDSISAHYTAKGLQDGRYSLLSDEQWTPDATNVVQGQFGRTSIRHQPATAAAYRPNHAGYPDVAR